MLDGQGSPEKYAKRAKELGMPAISQTDHGNVHGWLDFYDACKEQDVKPILGLEAYQARKTRFDQDEEERSGPAEFEWQQRGPYHLTLLAQNMDGYKNIIKLTSKSYLEGYYVKPRIDHELLAQHSKGVIILSGCLNGEVQQALLRGDKEHALQAAARMQGAVGRDNYFIEVQDHGLEEQDKVKEDLLDIAHAINAPIVPTGDCHYVYKEEYQAHDAMLCIGTKALVSDEKRFKFAGPHFYLQSYEEMATRFSEEWLNNTLMISDMVDLQLKFDELFFPEFPVPNGYTADSYLEELVWQGAKKRYGSSLSDVVVDRINHELGVVKRMGFQHYFLVVQDIVNWGKDQGIRFGPGRGSAAGCILSYCLRITDLEPIEFDLLFERFLVEGRKSMPDIDIDIDDRYRHVVIDYARNKFGANKVSHICTFSRLGTKSSIRDTARVLGYEYQTGDKLAKLVPPPVLGVAKTLEESLQFSEFKEAYENDNDAKHIIDVAKGLEGLPRQPGIHAAGVVIAKNDITDYIPVMLGGKKKDIVVTQWDMHRVEEIGLLKIDFLGLANLGIIEMCLDNIKKTKDIKVDIDNVSLKDEKTFYPMKKGECIGIFQLESGGMRDMSVGLRSDTIYDIMALVSLFRPGPMGSGMDKMYISRKHGRSKITYDHPVLESILNKTYGIMLYQEDVLNVAKHLAGFTPGEADDLRKAMGKKLPEKIKQFRQKFVEGCKKTNDVPAQLANKIYSDIEFFAGYGFNRAHAASYAVVAYMTAYLKTHYPVEYMAALLSSVIDSKDKLALYLNECRRLKLKVYPPSIAKSESEFTVQSDDEILYGLSGITGIGEAIVSSILYNREEYTNLYDYFRKCDIQVLNKGSLEHLIRAGAFDELIEPMSYIRFDRQRKLEILEQEKKELGIYVTDHPLLDVWDFVSNKVDTNIADIDTSHTGSVIKLGGIISSSFKRITKKNQTMYHFTLEDLTGEIEVVVFPRQAKGMSEDFLKSGEIGVVEGTISQEGDDEAPILKLFYNSMDKIGEIKGSKPIILKSNEKLTAQQMKRLYAIIDSQNGDSPVYLEYPEQGHQITIKFKKTTAIEVESTLQSVVNISGWSMNV